MIPDTSTTATPPRSTRARPLFAAAALGAALLSASCADRRMFITSEPTGADVFVNDVYVGRTPVEVNYTYTGVYDVRLRAPGHEPLVTAADTGVKLQDIPPIDLITQATPPTDRTRVEWHFVLTPTVVDHAGLLERARSLRAEANAEHDGEAPDDAGPVAPEPADPSDRDDQG